MAVANRFDELALRYLVTVRIAPSPSGCATCFSNRLWPPTPGQLLRRALACTPVPQFWQLAEQVTDAAREGDLTTFLDRDRKFHLGLLEILDNQRLVALVGQLRDQARMQGLQKLADRGELTHSGEEHVAIVDAIESGDGELTAELVRKHLAHSRGIWADRAEGGP